MFTQIRKIRSIGDEATGRWLDVYEAPSLEGTQIEVEVPRGTIHPRRVQQFLMDHGVAVLDTRKSLEVIDQAIKAEAPAFTRVKQLGWREGEQNFITHGSALGPQNNLLPPRLPSLSSQALIAKGTLEQWKRRIAIAQHSTTMILGLCVVFAAPLLRLLSKPSFALLLFGKSRSGKSTIQLVAGSVLGFKVERDLPTLDATDAGLRELAISFNDHPLLLNEAATANGNKSEVYAALVRSSYALLSGRDTGRHSSWSGERGAATFSTVGLISSEFSPDDWASRAMGTRDPGEWVRLIGVPVMLGVHTKTFDRPPTGMKPADLVIWSKEKADALTMGIMENAGTAWPAYIEILIKNREEYVARARKIIAAFEEKMSNSAHDDIRKDIVSKFGILKAGGILAVKAGILPCDIKIVARAIRKSCEAALAALPDPDRDLHHDILLLRNKLSGPTIIKLDMITNLASSRTKDLLTKADGLRRKEIQGDVVLIRGTSFRGWFKSTHRTAQLLKWLDDEGLLQQDRLKTSGRSIEWAQTQEKWPNGTRPRSIKLILPQGLKNLAR